MSAAVAQRAPLGRTSSPMDTKNIMKSEDSSATTKDQKPATDTEASQSIPPPPRPAASGPGDTPDYFNSLHNPFSLEPNPFEQSFGNPSAETPGKSLLPPVASITSPALPGASSAGYNWPNSLRSGPLSPAMLAGPTGSDYFDSIGRGFPTPNESSLRTGLTPGGGGSMFPAPSPNTQAILSQLQSGGATPSTLEFHRTALNAAKRSGFNVPTSNPTSEPEQLQNMDKKTAPPIVDQFTHHDAADAANGLFMLAKGGQPSNDAFSATNKPADIPDTKRSTRNAHNSVSSGREMTAEGSDTQGEQAKPAAKGKGKKNTPAKQTSSANGRRKAEEAPKGSNKRAKTNSGPMEVTPEEESDDDDMKDDLNGKDPKKMTDEEKRKNFLERNRVAALKCRQRKKQWLANLQAKVELFTTENDALTATVTQLREEIVNLKTLLLAHKDCPVSQAQGLGPLIMNGMSAGFDPHPYNLASNMAMQPGAPMAQAIRR
ncbi:Transcription factor Jun [Penicillium occitanis (nom. inval.)]|nr:Transcription factor Jun [Penicillium occitanis (nom. inval.)]